MVLNLKILFYDTCALLNTNFKSELQDKDTIGFISSITYQELEKIKTDERKDETTKYLARQVVHYLNSKESKLQMLPYKASYDFTLKLKNLPTINDNKIIVTFYKYIKSHHIKQDEYIFITTDGACKLNAEGFFNMNTYLPQESDKDDYTGFKIEVCKEEDLNAFYSGYLQNNDNIYNLIQNQYLLLKDETGKIVDKYKWKDNSYVQIPFMKAESSMFGKVTPKNGDVYQQLALDSLADNQITMLRGAAGSGKSYLAFGHMFSLLEKGKIDKIIIFCNTVATKGSAKLGFYPGSRTEKLLDSQIGNLLESKLGDRCMVEKLIDDGRLVLLPMSDIRGYDTTGMNAAVYISEAQNLDIELIKLALQRIGEDSICILDGDSNAQVDLSMYAGAKNGMRRVSKVFRGAEFYGEVTLLNIHRSKIAQLAQEL